MKNTLFLFALLTLLGASACIVSEDPITPIPEPDPEPTSLRPGLVFHAPFSGNADDIAVNGYAGTITGATLTADRHGVANEAYRFDGVDDVINYGSAPDLAFGGRSTFTMTAWVKLEDRGDNQRNQIISKFNGGVAAGWYLSVNADEEIQAYRNAAPWSVSGSPTVPYDEYVHVASSYDGSNFTVWLNGELSGTTEFGSHPSDVNTDMLVGAIHSQNNVVPLLKGTVDDIRVYNRLLTGEELMWLANN
ncbi:MAG: LamG domain-containing protein [Bacteroidota bacterium]